MPGVVLAALAGVGFGLFQATNARAGRSVDTYVATFGVLSVSVVVLALITVATQDLAVLAAAPPSAFGWFAVAGGVHFFLGWTFLTLSQRKLGASRTGVLTGTAPLFGTLLAFLALNETLRPFALVGVALVVAGTLALASSRPAAAATDSVHTPAVTSVLGLAAALCWGTSPVFVRWGLEAMPAPLIGTTIGLVAATTAYGLALLLRPRPGGLHVPRSAVGWLVGAGCLVGLAIAGQWVALSRAPVAAVLALSQLAVPVVVLAAPVLSGGAGERLNRSGMLAAAVIVAGSIIIIFARAGGSVSLIR